MYKDVSRVGRSRKSMLVSVVLKQGCLSLSDCQSPTENSAVTTLWLCCCSNESGNFKGTHGCHLPRGSPQSALLSSRRSILFFPSCSLSHSNLHFSVLHSVPEILIVTQFSDLFSNKRVVQLGGQSGCSQEEKWSHGGKSQQ